MSDLTTKAKCKLQLGIATTDTTSDDILDDIVTGISSQIETFCNRNFTRATYTQYIDTLETDQKLFVKNAPIVSITSLKYRGGTFGVPVWYDFIADYYYVSKEMGRIAFAGKLPKAEDYVQCIYVGGYLIDFANETDITKHTLPADLSGIATDMACEAYNLRKSGGVASESTEGQSVSYKQTSTNDMEKKLSAYRNYNLT
jgi:hypothetical protein